MLYLSYVSQLHSIFESLPPIGKLNLWDTKYIANVFAVRLGAILPPALLLAEPPPTPGRPLASGSGVTQQPQPHSGGPSTFFRPKFSLYEKIPVPIPFTGDGYQLRKKYVQIFLM